MSKKFKPTIDDGKIALAYDGNADGEDSISLSIALDESIAEILNRGAAIEGESKVKFKLDPIKGLSLQLDTDQDGEPSVFLEADIIEAVQESGLLK